MFEIMCFFFNFFFFFFFFETRGPALSVLLSQNILDGCVVMVRSAVILMALNGTREGREGKHLMPFQGSFEWSKNLVEQRQYFLCTKLQTLRTGL